MQNFVFDLYGTLVDIKTDETSLKFRKKITKYFARLNVSVGFFAEYQRLCAEQCKGRYAEADLLSVFRGICGDENAALRAARFFRKSSRSRLKLYKGARSLLKRLRSQGARLYLLSNAQACFTLPELEKLKLTEYFNGIELSSEFGEKKPSPAFFGHAIKKYSLDPAKTVYVGNDFNSDILGAKAAGLSAAYIKSNLSPEADSLEQAKKTADFATDGFKELSQYLIGSTL